MESSQPSSVDRYAILCAKFADEILLGISETDGFSVFPDGSPMAICTNCANRVVKLIGRGEVWGYSSEDNPETEAANGQDGHDFAIIDEKYIVDVWLCHYAILSERAVFIFHQTKTNLKYCAFTGTEANGKLFHEQLELQASTHRKAVWFNTFYL